MRGQDHQQTDIFSYVSPEQRVRPDHPLRAIRAMADKALVNMSERFDAMYAKRGRPSIPPEKLLRAQLIQMLYSVRSERLLMEEIDYSLLFRWFVGMNLDEAVWDVTVFTKNRDRLLDGDVAREFLSEVVRQAREEKLTGDKHFTVDGTLIEAWASLKSFQRKDQKNKPPSKDDPGNPTVNFHGESRSNETHESTTDPDALLARKGDGKEAKLSYNGNLLIEKPERVDRKHGTVPGQWNCRAGCGIGDAGTDSRRATGHRGSGQGLRHERLRGRVPQSTCDSARGAEPQAERWQRD